MKSHILNVVSDRNQVSVNNMYGHEATFCYAKKKQFSAIISFYDEVWKQES